MSCFVLIHGAWHGGWCWEQVAPLLTAAGHQVIAPDLPGHGDNQTSIAEVTLSRYVDCVCRLLDQAPEPVVLVGHSMGGIVISQATEQRPERVSRLVYLTAFLIGNGESLLETNTEDTESLLGANRVLSEDKLSLTLRTEAVTPAFYADCPAAATARAQSRLVPQAVAPLRTPLQLTRGNWGQIPRAYIECLRDRALTPKLQKSMYTAHPCEPVLSLGTGHFPHYAAPARLAELLLTFAN